MRRITLPNFQTPSGVFAPHAGHALGDQKYGENPLAAKILGSVKVVSGESLVLEDQRS